MLRGLALYPLTAVSIVASLAVPIAAASDAMPVAQQNALVQKYCAVCHTDLKPLGGLSLEKFDAAHPDPSLAAMLVSKLKARAMGASGILLPDRATQDAFLSALSAEAVGASAWTVTSTQNPATQAPILTASIVQEASSETNAEASLYRLKLTCHVDTHEAEMQLTWAPAPVPPTTEAISAAVDGNVPFTYKVKHGEAAAILYAMPLPAQTLTIGNLFPGETVVFPFGGLNQAVRQTLSTCFKGSSTARRESASHQPNSSKSELTTGGVAGGLPQQF